jgi:hypothetical protein
VPSLERTEFQAGLPGKTSQYCCGPFDPWIFKKRGMARHYRKIAIHRKARRPLARKDIKYILRTGRFGYIGITYVHEASIVG